MLPTPQGSIDVDSALSQLLKIDSALNAAQTDSAKTNVAAANAQRKEAAEKRQQAIDAAIAAQKKAEDEASSGGFFDSITKNLGPVGLVGLCVGSIYIVAADLAAHAVGLEDSKMDLGDAGGAVAMLAGPAGVAVYAAQLCMKHFGPDGIQEALDKGPTVKDDDVRKANKIAFAVTQAEYAVAATVASGGAAAPMAVALVGIGISTTAQVMQETGATKLIFGADADKVTLGASLTGAALSFGGGLVAAAGSTASIGTAAMAVDKAKTVTEAVHDVNQGVSNLQAARDQRAADNLHADAEQQKLVVESIGRLIDVIIDDVKNLKESAQKTSELVQGALQTQSQTLLLAGNMKA